MSYKHLIIVFYFSLLCYQSTAQISVPPIEFQVKGGVAALTDVVDSYENTYFYIAPLLYAEINWNITQHFSLGAFASAGAFTEKNFKVGYNNSGDVYYGGYHSAYGVKIRLSTGRAPRFRPFTELSYGKLEMEMEKNSYNLGSSTSFIGWSLGLMIRAGSRLYFVLPQASIRFRSQGFFFEAPNDYTFNSYAEFLELCAGVSYNIGKKK